MQDRPILNVRPPPDDDRSEIGPQHGPYQTDASASARTSPTRVAVGATHAAGLASVAALKREQWPPPMMHLDGPAWV